MVRYDYLNGFAFINRRERNLMALKSESGDVRVDELDDIKASQIMHGYKKGEERDTVSFVSDVLSGSDFEPRRALEVEDSTMRLLSEEEEDFATDPATAALLKASQDIDVEVRKSSLSEDITTDAGFYSKEDVEWRDETTASEDVKPPEVEEYSLIEEVSDENIDAMIFTDGLGVTEEKGNYLTVFPVRNPYLEQVVEQEHAAESGGITGLSDECLEKPGLLSWEAIPGLIEPDVELYVDLGVLKNLSTNNIEHQYDSAFAPTEVKVKFDGKWYTEDPRNLFYMMRWADEIYGKNTGEVVNSTEDQNSSEAELGPEGMYQ